MSRSPRPYVQGTKRPSDFILFVLVTQWGRCSRFKTMVRPLDKQNLAPHGPLRINDTDHGMQIELPSWTSVR